MSQPHQMATMGGPVGGGHQGQQHPMNAGTPNSGSGPPAIDAVKRLNTAIYDYLLRNALYDTARSFVNSPHMDVETGVKKSPSSDSRQSQQQANGVGGGGDEMEIDNDGIKNRPGDLPAPLQLGDGPFLQDWWCQFWEIFQGYRNKGKQHTLQYIGVQRQAQKARTNAMVDPQGAMRQQAFNGAGQMIGGGGMNGDLKRVAMQNPRNMFVVVVALSQDKSCTDLICIGRSSNCSRCSACRTKAPCKARQWNGKVAKWTWRAPAPRPIQERRRRRNGSVSRVTCRCSRVQALLPCPKETSRWVRSSLLPPPP